MRSFININALTIAAVAFTVLCMKANADIITYTGDECQAEASVDFLCDGLCRSFANRRSFRVDVPGNHCVTIYQDAVCKNPVTAFGNPPAAQGICIEVSTGTPQLSFTCASNTNCNN
ncbi:hypothetical protein B0H19DRAFT_994462 [Mycena capillaripes]|nr:hypothetical protein B0H19DRAFT_994462 [Mycena capillaripes]